jgi:hypothetical protein
MLRRVCFPSIVKEWNEELDFENPADHAATTLSNLYVDFTNLRGHADMGNEYDNPERVVSEAAAIDAGCVEWAQTCPPLYFYRTVKVKGISNDVFSNHYHSYNSVWAASIWNNYRTFVFELMSSCLIN